MRIYSFALTLVRPDGQTEPFGTPQTVPLNQPRKFPTFPVGVNVGFQGSLSPSQLGLHYLVLSIDGEEVYKATFTLAPQPAQN